MHLPFLFVFAVVFVYAINTEIDTALNCCASDKSISGFGNKVKIFVFVVLWASVLSVLVTAALSSPLLYYFSTKMPCQLNRFILSPLGNGVAILENHSFFGAVWALLCSANGAVLDVLNHYGATAVAAAAAAACLSRSSGSS